MENKRIEGIEDDSVLFDSNYTKGEYIRSGIDHFGVIFGYYQYLVAKIHKEHSYKVGII